MADVTEGDASILSLKLLVLAVIAFLPGLMIHSFIIGVNVNDWWKGRSLTSVDHIITSLGISRLCAQFALTFYFFLATIFQSSLDLIGVREILGLFYAFFYYYNIWLTTLLSIVFCLKISNLRIRIFLYLEDMILNRTAHYIGASGLLSVINMLTHILLIIHNKVFRVRPYNVTMDYNQLMDYKYEYFAYNFIMGALMPILFFFISSILLFVSLYHHTVKMKRSSNLSINLEIYYSAMKFVAFTIIYNTMYFIGHSLCAYNNYFYYVYLLWPYIILDFLPVLHSSYLINRTAKLRSQMSKVLQNVVDFLFQRKDSKTRENIEDIEEVAL